MKNKKNIVMQASFIFGISLFSHSTHSGTTVYLENNYGAMLNYVVSSGQPEGKNIGNNVRVSLNDVNYIPTLSIRTIGYLTYGSPLNLYHYIIDIKNQQTKHANDDAIIAIEPSTSYTTWNVKLRWETKGKIKSFEPADFPVIVGAPKVQPAPSQPLTQPAVTMDVRELEVMIAETADERLTLIKNGNLGPDYARKATDICKANYTQAEKLGKINLCSRLKTELLAPQYGIASKKIKEQIAEARRRGQRTVEVLPNLAPAIDDIKSSITRLHNALAGYISRGEAL
jgi:hypothetical protein